MSDADYRTYLVSYNHEGANWSFEIKARDLADAQARVNRLSFAQLDGEIMARVPVPIWPVSLAARIRVIGRALLGGGQ